MPSFWSKVLSFGHMRRRQVRLPCKLSHSTEALLLTRGVAMPSYWSEVMSCGHVGRRQVRLPCTLSARVRLPTPRDETLVRLPTRVRLPTPMDETLIRQPTPRDAARYDCHAHCHSEESADRMSGRREDRGPAGLCIPTPLVWNKASVKARATRLWHM